MHYAVKVLIASSIAFFIIFILSKLLGKKQISQLDFVDYVIGISIGSIAAEMAAETERSLWVYIVAMAVFFILDLFVNYIGRKGPMLKKIMKGKPVVIIYENKIISKNLKKSKLDVNDLLMLLREKDVFDITKVQYAILETNGNLSVMPIGEESPTVAKDLKIEIKEASLPNYLVADGNISHSGLFELNKDKEWLFEKLGIKDRKELKKIMLASYDDESDEIIVHWKE